MIKQHTLVACSWYSPDYPDKTKNAIGLVEACLPRRRKDNGSMFVVQLIWPVDLAHRSLQILGKDMIPLLQSVTEDEAQYQLPEAILNLARIIDEQQKEIALLKEALNQGVDAILV